MFSGIFDVTSTPRQLCTDENLGTAQKRVLSSVRKPGRKPLADCTPRLKKSLFSTNRVNETNQINYEIPNYVKPEIIIRNNEELTIKKNFHSQNMNEHCFQIPQDNIFIAAEPDIVPSFLAEFTIPDFD